MPPTSAQDWVTVWEEHHARLHLSERETETIKKQIQGVAIQRDRKNREGFQIWQLSPTLNGCGQVLVRGQGRWTMGLI